MTAYAVFGGADFGAGFWSLVAGGGERGRRARELIDWAIGPVWEANHVWLIFVLVVLWTGFSAAFESIFSTLFIPLSLAALGIVLRGSGFAFHKTARRLAGPASSPSACSGSRRCSRRSSWAPSSARSPSGRVPVGNAAGDPVTQLAQPALAADRRAVRRHLRLPRGGVPRQRRPPRRRRRPRALLHRPRARRPRVVAGALAVAGIVALHADARYVYDGLTGDGLPLVIVSALCGAARARAAAPRRRAAAPAPLAVGAVVAVVWGWGVAQHPYLLPQDAHDRRTAPRRAPRSPSVLIVFGVAVVLVAAVDRPAVHARAARA